jgi:hypothetical protein
MNQVNADILKAGLPGCEECLPSLVCGVDTPKRSQHFVIKRLDTERKPSNSGLAKVGQPLKINCSGVGFKSDFSLCCQPKQFFHLTYQVCYLVRVQQGWCPATEIDGVQLV